MGALNRRKGGEKWSSYTRYMYNIIVYSVICTYTCNRSLSYLFAFDNDYTGIHVAEGIQTKKRAHAEVHVQDTVSYSLIQECYGSLDNMIIITIVP